LQRTAEIRERTQVEKAGKEPLPQVLAAEDALVHAGSVRNVRVIGPFTGCAQWIIEKVVISTDDCSVLAALTIWINSANPFIPITSPSTHPWYIQWGEVVGHLVDPSAFVDKPKDAEQRTKMMNAADAIRITVGMLRQ
jgi:hypothetical protein